MAEVINLSDDDDNDICEIPISKKKSNALRVFKCLNPDCRKTINLTRASESVRRYYGVHTYPKKIKVCMKCFSRAEIQKQSVVDLMKAGHNIMGKEISPSQNPLVLADSDSDITDDGNESVESEYEYDLEQISISALSEDITDDPMEQLKTVITDIMSTMSLDQHLVEGQSIVESRLEQAERDFIDLNKEYSVIEKEISKLRNNFYSSFKQEIKWLPALEIGPPDMFAGYADVTEVISESSVGKVVATLPPFAPLTRPPLKPQEKVYAMRYSNMTRWIPAVIDSIERTDPKETFFMIQYLKGKEDSVVNKIISGKSLAYYEACPTRIPVGTRVIAKFDKEKADFYFVGVIAEIPTGANKYRYLIFFDDGYAQYVIHQDIRVVSQSSNTTWEDVSLESREFIRDYLQTYPERPMVRLVKYNFVKTELLGKWWKAQVLEVDCSLAKMLFPLDERTEWIYRGSTRLSPLFNKKMKIQIKPEHPTKVIRRRTMPPNRSGPIVEYVNLNEDDDQLEEETEPPTERRAIARKSTASRSSISQVTMKESLILESNGFYRTFPIDKNIVKFKPHQCSPRCLAYLKTDSGDVSPLLMPMNEGWKRQKCIQKKRTVIQTKIIYVAPCGRRLRSLEEIFRYLRLTQSELKIDHFTVDPYVNITREWEAITKNVYVEDISAGKEAVKISCLNSIDFSKPNTLIYSSVRLPTQNVILNLDPNFMVCCSCEDDCQDQSKCECWQLTIESTKLLNKSIKADVGYEYRMLHEQVTTGIYECNHLCSCKSSCLNRVVQFPIKQKLQLFKTARRGWGVRTLHDIPKGSFICVYVGKVLTEAEANEDGMTDGADDYYAELDFIEVIENMKEGYESEVEDNDIDLSDSESIPQKVEDLAVESTNGNQDLDEIGNRKKTYMKDNTYYPSSSKHPLQQREKSVRLLAKQINKDKNGGPEGSTDSSERRPQTFEPQDSPYLPFEYHKSLRHYYNDSETVYIMDAKITGNIGRYLNHSCSPTIFVQNVFVDTHDPRFPWISFFAGTNITAGDELTWDYNYEIGSVPGKVKYCYCKSSNCCGRLL